jgi:hypothetical protein
LTTPTLSVAAPQLRPIWPSPPVAVSVPGALGAVVSGAVIDVFMSDVICVAVRATFHKRTSSIRPLNHSPQMPLPPILSGPVELMIGPVKSSVPTWVPLTYSASTLPSYVAETYDQVFSGSCAVPLSSWSDVV